MRAPGRQVRLLEEEGAGALAEGEVAACGVGAEVEAAAVAGVPLEEALAWVERLGAGRLRDRGCTGTTDGPGEP
ncbi:MAG: hypothetical protein MUQ65_17380 [Armatimonadetes bacterium]|nr:hypothetical protein [Armatimonadota bacterium]